MKNIIVLTTGGKTSDVYKVRVDIFEDSDLAKKYIEKVNVDKDDRFWYRAEIIVESILYELGHDQLYEQQNY